MRQFLESQLRSWFTRKSKRTAAKVLEINEVIDQIIQEWPAGRPFRVDDVLAIYPELKEHRRAVIEFAVEEYAVRRANKESLSADEFAERFPSIRTALLDSLLVDQALTQLTNVFGRKRDENATKWPQPGDTVANFHLLELIGKGAFSRVFLAEDLTLKNRQVAVKFCRNDSYEIEALSQLQHSSIGVVLEVREVPERDFAAISMQMQGRATLDNVIRNVWKSTTKRAALYPRTAMRVWEAIRDAGHQQLRPQSWSTQSFADWSLQLAQQLASALDASHSLDFVHCDIKPSNVLITLEGKPVLIDFNVSFRSDAAHSPANIGGTLPYMAPEQVRAFAGRGHSDVGPQTDLFGWGATLYQLLTGNLPFGTAESSEDGVRSLLRQREIAPPHILTINPDIDERFANIVMKCMNYDIADRPASAELVADELSQIQKARQQTANIRRTDRWRVGIATTLAAAAIAGVSLKQSDNPPMPLSINAPEAQQQQTEEKELLRTAFGHLDRGDLEQSKLAFKRVLEQEPGHEGAKLGLARVLTRCGDDKEVDQLLSEIVWEGGEPPEVLAFRGYRTLWGSKSKDALNSALSMFEQWRRLNPEHPAVLTDMALCHLRFGRIAAAVPLLERARLHAPNNQNIAILLMRSYINARASVADCPTSLFDVAFVDELAATPITTPQEHWDVAIGLAVVSRGIRDTDAEIGKRLSRQAVSIFENGCASTAFRQNWHQLRVNLDQELLAEVGPRFADVKNDAVGIGENTRIYSLDPLSDTRFGRTLQSDLDSRAALAVTQR